MGFPCESVPVWRVVDGSKSGGDVERFPPSCAEVGITWRMVEPRVLRNPSYQPNPQILFLMMGPPIVPPNWFWWNVLTVGLKKLRASRSVLRRNSHAAP